MMRPKPHKCPGRKHTRTLLGLSLNLFLTKTQLWVYCIGKIHLCTRAHLHPRWRKKSKQILEKFKKFQFFCVVDNLLRETRSKFQVIWIYEKLSAKETNWGSVKMFTIHVLFWPDLFFFLSGSIWARAQMRIWLPGSAAPSPMKKIKTNTRKIQKVSIFLCGR